MKQLFVDTSAWDALADKADKDHPSAIRFRNEVTGRRKLVTSNYILDELFTLLLMNIGHARLPSAIFCPALNTFLAGLPSALLPFVPFCKKTRKFLIIYGPPHTKGAKCCSACR